jgi:dimethylaniline monooxygenase (N-oxide forming)
LAESSANSFFDHEDYQLKPQHRILAQHPMINDALPNRILSGTVIVKANIDRFTENGVIFEGDYKKFI